MNNRQRQRALKLAKTMLPAKEFDKILSIEINDTGFGYDPFGMEKEAAVLAFAVAYNIYKYYFRVKSNDSTNIVPSGRALVVSNHSGVLPIDAAMIGVDCVVSPPRPRVMRAMVDNFMGFLPYVSTMFYRIGQVVGARRNFEDLLQSDELVAVFPEGTKGLGKPFAQRYNLVKFNVGFIELSLTHRAPIIPCAVVGCEEQAPLIYDLKPIARMLNFPYFPVTLFFPWLGPMGIVPLPVQYHIYYDKPLHFYEEYPPETVKDPETIRMLADKVQLIVQELVNRGLEERRSVFGFNED